MRRPFRLSRQARLDLLQIWNYLVEQASFDVADRVIADLYVGMDKLGKSTGIGHSREDLTSLPVKFYRVHKYLIVYSGDTKPIGIARVLHGSRDIPSILQDE